MVKMGVSGNTEIRHVVKSKEELIDGNRCDINITWVSYFFLKGNLLELFFFKKQK